MSEGKSEGSSRRLHRFGRSAMAAEFEILVAGEDGEYARQACQAALDRLEPLEFDLSRYIETSDVARINHAFPGKPVTVSLETLECLELAGWAWAKTGGAFDVTIGPLLSLWRENDTGRPGEAALKKALSITGMDLLALDHERKTVEVKKEGVVVDLGGIGKGYALDIMSRTLEEWEVDSALLQGGQSTCLAMGEGNVAGGWKADLRDPRSPGQHSPGEVVLKETALSGSGTLLQGKHIIDPVSGRPCEGKLAAWAVAPSAAAADALSTAFMIMEVEKIDALCQNETEIGGAVLIERKGKEKLIRFGM